MEVGGEGGRGQRSPEDLAVGWDCYSRHRRSGCESGSTEKSSGGKWRARHVEFKMPARYLGGTLVPGRVFLMGLEARARCVGSPFTSSAYTDLLWCLLESGLVNTVKQY